MSDENKIRSYDDFRKDKFFNVTSIQTRTSVSNVELPCCSTIREFGSLTILSLPSG